VRVYDAATGAFEWGDRLVSFVPGNPQNEGPGGEVGTLALEVGKGRVFIATGRVARAYDLKTGAQLWEFSFYDPVYDLHVSPQRNLPKALRLLGCTSSESSGPFGLLSKSHSRHVAIVMPRSDSPVCAAPASRV
jgi:hypothetical protein